MFNAEIYFKVLSSVKLLKINLLMLVIAFMSGLHLKIYIEQVKMKKLTITCQVNKGCSIFITLKNIMHFEW